MYSAAGSVGAQLPYKEFLIASCVNYDLSGGTKNLPDNSAERFDQTLSRLSPTLVVVPSSDPNPQAESLLKKM